MRKLHSRFSHAGRNGTDLDLFIHIRRGLVTQRLIALDTRFLFRGTRLGSAFDPFDLLAQHRLALTLPGDLTLLPHGFPFQKTGVVRVIAVDITFIDLHNAVRYAVKEVAVMRYHDKGALPFFQIILQPVCHLMVDVVGRLVQKQDVTRH